MSLVKPEASTNSSKQTQRYYNPPKVNATTLHMPQNEETQSSCPQIATLPQSPSIPPHLRKRAFGKPITSQAAPCADAAHSLRNAPHDALNSLNTSPPNSNDSAMKDSGVGTLPSLSKSKPQRKSPKSKPPRDSNSYPKKNVRPKDSDRNSAPSKPIEEDVDDVSNSKDHKAWGDAENHWGVGDWGNNGDEAWEVQLENFEAGDPNYDVSKLMDWNGGWNAAPIEWTGRKPFIDRHPSEVIEWWIEEHPKELLEPISLDHASYRGIMVPFENGSGCGLLPDSCKEIVPKYWSSLKVERKPIHEFWKDFQTRAPNALDEEDTIAISPWWDRYHTATSCFIQAVVVPEAPIDPEDSGEEINLNRYLTVEHRIQDLVQRRIDSRARKMARQHPPIPLSVMDAPPVQPKGIQPRANIYIRPVIVPADVSGILDIYNYYADKTHHVDAGDRRDEEELRNSINETIDAGLPYLVAVCRRNKVTQFNPHQLGGKIVGFISLTDFYHKKSMYKYTFTMELFTHPGYINKKISKCLLDQMLAVVDPGYKMQGGCDVHNVGEIVPQRIIKTIIVDKHHGHGEDIKWVSDYFRPFGFTRCGHESHMGYQNGQDIDISSFQYHTAVVIDRGTGLPEQK